MGSGGGALELLKVTIKAVEDGHFWQVAILILLAGLPWIVATGSAWWLKWQVGKLYERMAKDKDREIDRLAAMNKQLQNALLNKKR